MLRFCTVFEQIGYAALAGIPTAFEREPHLLPLTTEELVQSLRDGLAMVVCDGHTAVACTRLIPLVDNWYELGSTWVRIGWRDRKINHEMYGKFLPLHRSKHILATTTNRTSVRVGDDLGFIFVPRKSLPERVWRATCVCPSSKTGTTDNVRCQLAWGEHPNPIGTCWIRITRETSEMLNLAAETTDRCI